MLDASRRLAERVLREGQEMNAPRDEVESRPRTDAASPPDIRMSEASSASKEEFESGHQTEVTSPLSDRMPEEADESEHEPDVILIEPGVMFIDPVSFALAKLTDQLNEEVMKDIMETIAQPAIANVIKRRSKDLNETITLYNAGKRDSQTKASATLARARDELPLLMELAGPRPQSPFQGITWSAEAVVKGDSPQACDANIDCGPFSIDTAVQRLRGEAPAASLEGDTSRVAYGRLLRRCFLEKLRNCLLNV
ncbi:hypothetical protein H2201_008214 [Coniosporium apollinis]|uniref:Uncharacterized protein n=1 Tax=Coniosporium apollinis TaxID=61459 RepID=A0ABQ9NH99_9PEZI|nr:hypothetical protein H2201_008214 [Coniosporium apollinis]